MKEDDRNDAQSNRPVCCIIQEVREREEPVLFKVRTPHSELRSWGEDAWSLPSPSLVAQARFSDWLDDESGKWGAKEKQAPRDFRSPHQRLLDEIRKRVSCRPVSGPQGDTFGGLTMPLSLSLSPGSGAAQATQAT